MQNMQQNANRYDATTILFHWLTAFLVLEQIIGAHTIDWFPRGALRTGARSMHILLGAALVAIILARIIWRLTRGRRLPPADQGALHIVATATQWALYALLLAMLALGLALTSARADTIFGLFKVPSFAPGDRAIAGSLQDLHALGGWAILALSTLHGAAALTHRYLWHDGVLARMLPWRTRPG